MSPLSASCSKDCSTSPPPSKRSKSRSKKRSFHQLLWSHQLLLSFLSHQLLLSLWSLARAGTASEATTSVTTDASNTNFFNSSTSSSSVPTNYRKDVGISASGSTSSERMILGAQKDESHDPKRILRSFTGRSQGIEVAAKRPSGRAGAGLFPRGAGTSSALGIGATPRRFTTTSERLEQSTADWI